MIYLDNAATSYPKPQIVYDEVLKCMKEYCANPGRSGHSMSLEVGKAIFEARESISSLFQIDDPMRICFTKNATEALNIGIKGILNDKDHVIISSMEHNAVIRPIKTLQNEKKIFVSLIETNEYGEMEFDSLKKLINKNTKLIISTSSSNVNGIIMPIKKIGKFAKENGILFLVDASQGAGCIPINVKKMNIDVLAFPGHKGLLGPQGTGGIYVKKGINVNSIIEGGTGSNSKDFLMPKFLPDFLESGTLNTAGIIGLRYGIEYIKKYGIKNIIRYKYKLVKMLHEGIEELKDTKIYSKKNIEKNTGIVAFDFKEIDSTEISHLLNFKYNIATRAGMHCAPLAHNSLGTLETGVVRLSVGCFNNEEDIKCTLNALRKISINYK